jgi:hypothetical protein
VALIRDIAIGLSVSSGAFTAGMKSAEASLGRFGSAAKQAQAATTAMSFRSATSGVNSMRVSVGGLRAALLTLGAGAAIGKISSGITGAVSSASDLSEQISKSRVVFGAASAKVEADATKMGDAFGYPKAEFIEGASSIGLIAKASGLSQNAAAALGSSFATLAADASSFYNVPVGDALNAIRSGLVGEAEPMRRFGVLLNEAAVKAEAARMGIAKLGAELTEGQKVQARSSLISKGLTDAQGDLGRTATGVANMARTAEGRWTNAMADMGAAILPVTESLYGLRDSALRALTEAIVGNSDSIKAWATDAASSGGLVSQVFEGVGTAVGFMADGFQLLDIGIQAGQAAVIGFGTAAVGAFIGAGQTFDALVEKLAGPGIPKMMGGMEKDFLEGMQAASAVQTKELQDAQKAPWASEAIRARFAAITAGTRPATANAAAATPRATDAAAANAKLQKGVSDLTSNLQKEIATFGMAGKAAEIYKLKMAGASKEQIAAVTALDAQLQGLKIKEETESPLAKLEKERARLQGLFDVGGINTTDYGRAMKSAREGLGMSTAPRFAAAVTAGTTEEYSSQLRFGAGKTAMDEPIKSTAKSAEKAVDLQTQMVNALNKLVERGLGKVGDAAMELFAL